MNILILRETSKNNAQPKGKPKFNSKNIQMIQKEGTKEEKTEKTEWK